MLQRDYIQRLIREFMAALERMLEKKEVEVRREKIKELYNQYVGPYAFYSIATIEDVMKAMAGIDDEEKRLSKMDMLGELYYHEADMVGQPARDELLNKAFMLFDYVETHGDTFSIERRNKMASHKLMRIFDKCVRKNIDTFPLTRHRAIAWSCGSTYYAHGVQWLYNCWGILCLINMDSLTGHNIVDTEDRDIMMSDVADWHARTPMRTHTVGGNRHLMQMWETAEKFNCDMIIMYDDIGCKGMAGAQGLIEEEIRKHDERFHTVWMPHSLMDHRIVSPAEARRTVNEYMINVMHEEPVDPSLLDFDDSMGW